MNQKGSIPLLLLIAGIGVIAALAVVSLAPFKNKLLGSLFPKQFSFAASSTDWPQVQKDPQRTGFTTEALGTTWKVKWTFPFQPERVYAQVQGIVYDNKVYIGTEMGNMYTIDAVNPVVGSNPPKGRVVWKTTIGSPILNSVAADNGKVYFGAMDGAIYALNTSDGTQAWKTQLSSKGFSTAPLMMDNKIMLGGRDGKFYAVDPATGNKLWEYDAGSPILQTAAGDQGKAFFGSMDMIVHGVNTADGTGAWKSPKIKGLAFKDYWPLVTQGVVVIVPWGNKYTNNMGVNPGWPFSWFNGATIPSVGQTDWNWLTTNGPTIASGNLTQIPLMMSIQDTVLNAVNANPENFSPTLNLLNENTGQVAFNVVHNDGTALDGGKAPPCVDRDGKLIYGTNFIQAGWGRIDLTSKKIIDLLYDGLGQNGQPVSSTNTNPKGAGNADENIAVSCAQNMVMAFHHQEGNAQYTGFFNQDTRKWSGVGAGYKNGQMNEVTEAAGTNPASVSNGVVYHISVHELIARTTN